MYVRKSIMLMILLINLGLLAYVLIDNRVILASSNESDTAIFLNIDSTMEVVPPAPAGGSDSRAGWLDFSATAYCNFGITKSGVWVQRGIIAIDPDIIPLGSIVEVEAGKYTGLYLALDTGLLIQGPIIDIYMPTVGEAVEFGRQRVKLRIIRRGWAPGSAGEPASQG